MNNTHNGNPPHPERPQPPLRKRGRSPGGQPGNQNARKHGRYSALPNNDIEILRSLPTADLRLQQDALRNVLIDLLMNPDAPENLILRTASLLCTFRRRHKSPRRIRQANAALRMIQKGEA